jgi:hypothetical protein
MGERYHRPAHWLPHVGLLMWDVSDELSDIAEAMSEVPPSLSRDGAPKVKVQGTRVRKRGTGKAVSAYTIDIHRYPQLQLQFQYVYIRIAPSYILPPPSPFPLHHHPPRTLHPIAHPSPSPRPDPA